MINSSLSSPTPWNNRVGEVLFRPCWTAAIGSMNLSMPSAWIPGNPRSGTTWDWTTYSFCLVDLVFHSSVETNAPRTSKGWPAGLVSCPSGGSSCVGIPEHVLGMTSAALLTLKLSGIPSTFTSANFAQVLQSKLTAPSSIDASLLLYFSSFVPERHTAAKWSLLWLFLQSARLAGYLEHG